MIQKLNNYHAFKPGSEIWFLPEKKISQWARQIDWHINFLQANSSKKQKHTMSNELLSTIKNEELEINPHAEFDPHVLLIATQDYLPNKAIAIIKQVTDTEEWIKFIKKTCLDLKSENIRIFLPKNLPFLDVKKYLSDLPDQLEITVVEDGQLLQEKS